jgi:hypothetical protein
MTQNIRDVHSAVATIEAELLELSSRAASGAVSTEAIVELRASWAALVRLLALMPAAAVRDCPRCRQNVMRAATRCGFCWMRLIPPIAEA